MRTMMMMAIAAGACLACSDEGGDEHGDHEHEAVEATLAPKSGNTTLAGSAKFSGEPGAIKVTLSVTGAPAGTHGVHIHETGDCSAMDAMSAGAHWNPTTQMHGAGGAATSHLGDLGNLEVKADGTGTLTGGNAGWQIGTGAAADLMGKAVIVHAMPDDLMTQPTGNSGGRIGCGVIQ